MLEVLLDLRAILRPSVCSLMGRATSRLKAFKREVTRSIIEFWSTVCNRRIRFVPPNLKAVYYYPSSSTIDKQRGASKDSEQVWKKFLRNSKDIGWQEEFQFTTLSTLVHCPRSESQINKTHLKCTYQSHERLKNIERNVIMSGVVPRNEWR